MSKEVMKLALEALEALGSSLYPQPRQMAAMAALRAALAEPVQEPVAWVCEASSSDEKHAIDYWPGDVDDLPIGTKLYTSPPASKPLTSQERDAQRWRFLMENSYDSQSVTQFHIWEHSWEPHSKTGEPTEWKQRVRGIALIDFIDRAIEAKLKEKNA